MYNDKDKHEDIKEAAQESKEIENKNDNEQNENKSADEKTQDDIQDTFE